MVLTEPDLVWLTTSLVVFVKFCFTITFYVVHLVAMETYPTCVRQTGTSLGAVMGSSMGILGPYIVYLVSKHTRARQWFQPVIMAQRWTRVKPSVLDKLISRNEILLNPIIAQLVNNFPPCAEKNANYRLHLNLQYRLA